MVEAFTSRSGAVSVRVDGVALHSAYDPAREAWRFLETRADRELPSTIVVLGEGLGYLARAAGERYPTAKILRVHYSAEVFRLCEAAPGAAWHPGSPCGIKDFLRKNLDELDIEGLQIVEWPSSARLFAALSRQANESIRQLALELNGSLVTTLGTGRRWIRNSAANFLSIEEVLTGRLCLPERPVLIAASGPSLEQAVRFLRPLRDSLDLWALPSSLACLTDAGVNPDLIIMTDPGPYTLHHLRHTVRGCPIAMPLSAARGLWDLRSRGQRSALLPCLIAQPGPLEQPLLQRAGIAAPLVAPHGTVFATALDLALGSTRGPVIVAGLDLCFRDVQAHARPGAFDLLLHCGSSRLRPHYGQTYERARAQGADLKAGPRMPLALRTYAGWLSELPLGDRVYRLLPSAVPIPGMHGLEGEVLPRLVAASGVSGGARLQPDPRFPGLPERRRILAEILSAWLREIERVATEVRRTAGVSALHGPGALSALLLNLEGRSLLEIRRKTRLGERAAALATAVEMLERCSAFALQLRERTIHGGL